jgi:hypothetical protein
MKITKSNSRPVYTEITTIELDYNDIINCVKEYIVKRTGNSWVDFNMQEADIQIKNPFDDINIKILISYGVSKTSECSSDLTTKEIE